jgi:hypothetical protein
MSEPDAPGILGVVTAPLSFEIDQPLQVTYYIRGTCDSAQNGYLETTLEYLDTGHALVIARTRLHSMVRIDMANGATLYLPKGKYRVTARVRPEQQGGTLVNPSLEQPTVTINTLIELPYAIGQAVSAGSHESFLLVSVGVEMPVQSKATIREKLPKGKYLSGSLTITNTSTGNAIGTPRALLRGTNLTPLQLDAIPVYLKPGIIYRFDCNMIYDGEITSVQSIFVGP